MKKLLGALFLLFCIIPNSYALDSRVERIYGDFIDILDSKYSWWEKQIILEKLQDRAQDIRWTNISSWSQSIFDDLRILNNEYLYDVWLKNEWSQTQQKITELSLRKNLQKELSSVPQSQIVRELSTNSGVEFISTNAKRETVKNNSIQRVEYTKYFPVDSSTKRQLQSKKGIIIYEDQEYRFIEEYSLSEKIPYSEMGEYFSSTLLTPEQKVVLESGKYYTYIFTTFKYYQDDYWAYESQLQNSGFPKNGTLIYVDETWRYNFVTDYSKRFIINDSDVYWISWKWHFLDYLADDMKFNSSNNSAALGKMKILSAGFMNNSNSEDEYIEKVYNWILENISYTENINLENQEIFSALEAFNSKSGVCTAYSKLMSYFLYFWGISDAQMIKGNVIEAADFPQIGHAWVRIGDTYYDPTFDDPLGNMQVKQRDEYKYFWLPRDIFYANRYEYEDLPVGLKLATDQEIQEHIYDRLVRLIPKYQSSLTDYPVFGPVVFREKYNLDIETMITPQILANKIWSYSVQNNSFRFTRGDKVKIIQWFRYFVLTPENTEVVLSQLAYDTNDLFLFDWETEWGGREWRLAYEIDLK